VLQPRGPWPVLLFIRVAACFAVLQCVAECVECVLQYVCVAVCVAATRPTACSLVQIFNN